MSDPFVISQLPAPQPVSLPAEEARSEARKGFRHKDAVSLLRRLIEIGELAPGERLREVAISQRFGMSRTPVREAFRTLAAEGFIILLPNRSVVVSRIDRSEIADVFSVLSTLEGLAARQACERITDAEIKQIGLLQADLERYYGAFDRENYVNTNRAIHERIVQASRNSALVSAWRAILPRADRARNANKINRSRWTEAVHEHRMIYSALAERDAMRIAPLVEAHFRNGIAHANNAAAALSAQ